MIPTLFAQSRLARTPAILALACGAVVATSVTARAAVIMDDDFGPTDTTTDWTQIGGSNLPFFQPTVSRVTLSGLPGYIQHNITFNPSAGDCTITAKLDPTLASFQGFNGQAASALFAGIGSTPFGGFIGVKVFNNDKKVYLTNSTTGDQLLTTLGSFNSIGAMVTLNLFPATSKFEVLVSGAGTTSFDSGLLSLPGGFSFSSLGGNASALLGNVGADPGVNAKPVLFDRITITQTVPAPAAGSILALGAVAVRRRRRVS